MRDLSTNGALVGADAQVTLLVDGLGSVLREGLVAEGALVGLLPRVDALVDLNIGPGCLGYIIHQSLNTASYWT